LLLVEIRGGSMTIRRMIAAVGVTIALLMALAAPASAHDTDINSRLDRAWVRQGHTLIGVYDGGGVCEPGRVTYVHFYVSTIGGYVERFLNAPCGGIAEENWYPNQIGRYQVCNTYYGDCSPWRYT
jgi:hypothetical protein